MGVRHENGGQDHGENAEGQVHPEHPAPAHRIGDEAAHWRADQRPDQRRNGEPGQGIDQFRLGHSAEQDDAADRHHHCSADALKRPGRHQATQRIGHAAGQRPDGEDGDRHPEHMARAEAVGHPAAHRYEDGKAQEIGGEGKLQHDGIGPQRPRHGGKRRGDHRRIHVLHEQGGGDDEGDQPGGRHGPQITRQSPAVSCR